MDQSSTTHSFDTPIAKGSLPQVVIDLEKLRHINCGLGRFSLYLGQELLRIAADRYEPVFFLPRSGEPHFRNISCAKYDTIRVRPWRKKAPQRVAVTPHRGADRMADPTLNNLKSHWDLVRNKAAPSNRKPNSFSPACARNSKALERVLTGMRCGNKCHRA